MSLCRRKALPCSYMRGSITAESATSRGPCSATLLSRAEGVHLQSRGAAETHSCGALRCIPCSEIRCSAEPMWMSRCFDSGEEPHFSSMSALCSYNLALDELEGERYTLSADSASSV